MKMAKIFKLLAVILTFCTLSEVHAEVADSVGIVSDDQFVLPENKPGASAYIELTHQQQELNLCVPTSACMVLQRSGTTTSPREIKVLSSNKRQRRNQEFDDFTATMFVDLIAGLSKIGIRWEQRTFRNNRYGFRDGLKELKTALDAGNPVLVDTTLYGGHTFVVCGYDEGRQFLIAIDPNIPAPGLREVTYNDMEKIWNSQGAGSNIRGAVFTSTKR